MAYSIFRQIFFRGESVERCTEVAGDELRIGRGISNDLRLDDLAVSLSHAVIQKESESRYVLKDVTQAGATYLNRVPVTQAVVRGGDTIRIEQYLIAVSQPDPAGPLILRVTEEARPQIEPFLALLPKFQLSKERWTKRFLAVTAVLAILIGTAFAWGIGQRSVLMPGYVSVKHAKFSNQCEKCHDSWKAAWSFVPNKTCQTCHPAENLTPSHFGDRSVIPAPLCASCHLEHKGQAVLADVPDKTCVQCHGDFQGKEPIISVSNVHNFTKDHPEFAVSQWLPEANGLVRVRMDDKEHLQDGAALKLNHKVHLARDLRSSTGRETLTCASCHRAEEEGRYMQPVSYQRDCMRCHDLEFDPLLPGKSVSHGRQLPEVRQELEQIYAAYYLRTHPEEAKLEEDARKKGQRTRRLPGQPPTPKEIFVDDRRMRAERLLLPPKGKKCVKCHAVESGPENIARNTSETVTDAIGNINETLSGGGLDKGGASSLSSRSAMRIVTTNVPKRWLPYSRFDHDAHKGLQDLRAKGTWCLSCHEQAANSKKTEDVLMPSVTLCRTCHFEPGGAQAKCKSCHEFHERKAESKPSTIPASTDEAAEP